MPIADILRYNSLTWPDRVALVAGDRRITFSELEHAVWRLAGAMSGLCGPGDRVGILAQNVPEYVEALYGVPSAGLVLTLLNYRLNAKEWAWILANAEARVILVEQAYLADLDNGVFERLGRYEAALWRQVRQTLFTLEALRWRTSKPRNWRTSILGGEL